MRPIKPLLQRISGPLLQLAQNMYFLQADAQFGSLGIQGGRHICQYHTGTRSAGRAIRVQQKRRAAAATQ